MVNHSSYDKEFHDICSKMKTYIEKNCQHQIVTDAIDISPDCSKTIQYCTICMTNF
jgi:hypothetical protein